MYRFHTNRAARMIPYALEDARVLFLTGDEAQAMGVFLFTEFGEDEEDLEGWYFQYGFPGCLPDSDPTGPYLTAFRAIRAARRNVDGLLFDE